MPYDLSYSPGPFTGNLVSRIENQATVTSVGLDSPKIRQVDADHPKIWFLNFTIYLQGNSYIECGMNYQENRTTNGTTLLGHSFEFQNDGWYLQFDFDPERAEPFRHPEFHIHVNSNSPRYPFPENWDIVDFITFIHEQDLLEE